MIGVDQVPNFFKLLDEYLHLDVFELGPICVSEDGKTVMVNIQTEGSGKKTKRTFRGCGEVHIWNFNDQGKVSKWLLVVDFASETAAVMD